MDGWVEGGGKTASVKEIERDDRRAMGWVLEEKGSGVPRICSPDALEEPGIVVMEGWG